ncbi:MAG TPA: phosphotransferase [Mycobacterium sp.]|nr:phosphotransferase [Mycobacterium sp.]
MSYPSAPVPVPDVVTTIAAGRDVGSVWLNELGGATFSVGTAGSVTAEFVKVYPDEHAALLVTEAQRLTWAGRFLAVPRVISSGPGWLHTAGVPGLSAVDPYWVARPVAAARAIGAGLRRMHDTLPVAQFPFGRPSWIPADAPPADRLVVCHGDACAPNTLIADDGSCAGHVDLGDLGVADRWSDLAVATMSLAWDLADVDGTLEAALLDAYGVAPDPPRMAYYRERWEE